MTAHNTTKMNLFPAVNSFPIAIGQSLEQPNHKAQTLQVPGCLLDLIILRVPTNTSMRVEVAAEATLQDIKQAVYKELDLEPPEQIILFKGSKLQDLTIPLSSQGISQHCILYLLSTTDLSRNPLNLCIRHGSRTHAVCLPNSSSITELQKMVSTLTGLPTNQISLIYCGGRLRSGTLKQRFVMDGARMQINELRARARSKSLIVERAEEEAKQNEQQEEEDREEEYQIEIKEAQSIEDFDNELFRQLAADREPTEDDSFQGMPTNFSKKLSIRSEGVNKVKLKAKQSFDIQVCKTAKTGPTEKDSPLPLHKPNKILLKKIKQVTSQYDSDGLDEDSEHGQATSNNRSFNGQVKQTYTPVPLSSQRHDFAEAHQCFNSKNA